jgi:hypothetical protein
MVARGLLVLLVLLAGCGGTARVVRLETGEGRQLLVTPRVHGEPVVLDEDDFKDAVAEQARKVRPAERPLERARQFFGVPPTASGSYGYEGRDRRLVPLGQEAHLAVDPRAAAELTRAYLRWCERKGKVGDCLRVLEGGVLSADGKYALAMALALDSVWGETVEALGEMADPVAVLATVSGAGTVYFLLWLLPEPISKGVAATLTVALMAYVGVDTFWGLIGGWKQLVEAADRASTFEELREAGARYGEVMGENSARIFVMLTTAALGSTGAHLASKLPGLPGAQQAAVLLEAQVGVRYTGVAQVQAVAVSAEGAVLSLAPGAVAMSARGMSGGGAGTQGSPPPSGGPGEWVQVNESMSESARNYQAQVTGAPKGYTYRVKVGEKEVDFDGFKDGVLLEAKGPNLEQFISDKLAPKGFFKGADKMVEQAQRQFEVAQGMPIQWIIAEEKFAAALRILFKRAKLKIEVVHRSPIR